MDLSWDFKKRRMISQFMKKVRASWWHHDYSELW